MRLIELYDTLSVPSEGSNTLNAAAIPDNPEFRIALNCEGLAVLLLPFINQSRSSLKNFRFKYLQLEQDVECKIIDNGMSELRMFSLITFRSSERILLEYFFEITDTLIKTVTQHTSQQQIVSSLINFAEIFRVLSDEPAKTIAGLWAELFLINNAKNPLILLDYWHNIPEEKFDFNAGRERIEVKSSVSLERKHIFSSEQLNPPIDSQVLVASIFLKQKSSGTSVRQLANLISSKIADNLVLINKLNRVIAATLGGAFEDSVILKFDYTIAQQSLRFFKHQDIGKVESINIPRTVSNVKYVSDLTNIKPVCVEQLSSISGIFESLSSQ